MRYSETLTPDTPSARAYAKGVADREGGRARNPWTPETDRLSPGDHLGALIAYGVGYSGDDREVIVARPLAEVTS